MLIEVRCDYCGHLLCKVSQDFYGVIEVKCHHHTCRKINQVSLSLILKQLRDEPAILAPPQRTSAQ